MSIVSRTVFAAAIAGLLGIVPNRASAQRPACDVTRPIVFAGLDYESAALHTAIARRVLETGYGCKTDRIPGQAIPLLLGLSRGQIDVVMEVWLANPAQAWVDAYRDGKVVQAGTAFPDAEQGWFVPRYLVQGPDARAPNLKSVADLKGAKALFTDPEEPSKGRFLNCVTGWHCEIVNSKKLAAYGLDADYSNVRAGSGDALTAAIESALRRKRPVLFYMWSPHWMLGAFDLVKLDEPAFEKTAWDTMMTADKPASATAYPVSAVVVGANKSFADSAPTVMAFLNAYGMKTADINAVLAKMRADGIEPEAAARAFLKDNPAIWSGWVPETIATRVRAAL